MSEKKIKIGLVGCGRVSRTAHYDAIKNNPLLDFRAVCDIDRKRADTWAAKNNVKAYYSLDDLLESENLDLISINVPNRLHPELGIKASNKGVHVICEKPLGIRLAEVDELIACCKKNNVRLFTILQNRYNETNKLLKQSIENKRFGQIHTCNVTLRWFRGVDYYREDDGWRGSRELAGGVFTNQAVHYIDMMQWLIDSPVLTVYSKMDTCVHSVDVETHGSAIIRFSNGVIGSLDLTNLNYPEDIEGSITILGEKGTVKIGGKSMNQVLEWKFHDHISGDENVFDSSFNPPTVYGFGHQEFYDRVAKFLINEDLKNGVIGGLEGRKSVELLEALYRSSEESREITLPL
jgi:UDP-N-acetyl-2-amino-2-deoxyglucuronate dehydrogenase